MKPATSGPAGAKIFGVEYWVRPTPPRDGHSLAKPLQCTQLKSLKLRKALDAKAFPPSFLEMAARCLETELIERPTSKLTTFMTAMEATAIKDAKQVCARRHGCARKGRRTPEYRIWMAMTRRCRNANTSDYPDYGGRGVKVCDRWLGENGFANFVADMGHRPSSRHSIDRHPIKDGDYEPANCRWATAKEQARNTRRNRLITFGGETMCVAAWAEKLRVPPNILHDRLGKLGWSIDKALSTPAIKRRRNHASFS